jgi:hypothetical protein
MGEEAKMMVAPTTAFEVRRNANAPLTVIERIALECLKQIAAEGRQATQPELCAATGVGYQTGALPAILKRLEDKGHIKRQVFQRGMIVCIPALNVCTAPPKDTSPHWRLRTERVPTPAIQAVREHAKPVAAMIEAEARLRGVPLASFLADLVYIGWHGYQTEKEGAE